MFQFEITSATERVDIDHPNHIETTLMIAIDLRYDSVVLQYWRYITMIETLLVARILFSLLVHLMQVRVSLAMNYRLLLTIVFQLFNQLANAQRCILWTYSRYYPTDTHFAVPCQLSVWSANEKSMHDIFVHCT